MLEAVGAGDRLRELKAVICGHAVNQDGRSSSLTAPNGPSQQALIREAHASAGILADQLARLALHGTGTSLGDPIEIGAVANVFSSNNPSLLWMSADKSGFGHAEPAAGAVSLANGVHGVIHTSSPPMVQLRNLNPHVQHILSGQLLGSKRMMVPRQIEPMQSLRGRTDHFLTGSSGFAFQVCRRLCMHFGDEDSLPCPRHMLHVCCPMPSCRAQTATSSTEGQELGVHLSFCGQTQVM